MSLASSFDSSAAALGVESQLVPASPRRTVDARLLDRVCGSIAPTWPLDRFIAVNPLWNMTDRPLPEAAARVAALMGARLLMPRAWYRRAWHEGRFGAAHVEEALRMPGTPPGWTVARVVAALEDDEPSPPRRARVTDIVDAGRDLRREVSWRDFVVHSVSQACAAYFDRTPGRLGPERSGGLYAAWRRQALEDRSPVLLMRMRRYPELVLALPADPRGLIDEALAALDVPAHAREAYLAALLLDLNGWAAWCAYLGWTARLDGRDEDHLVELLAVRLAWEWLLHQGDPALPARWHAAMAKWPRVDEACRAAGEVGWILQRSIELAYQEPLCRQLAGPPRPMDAPPLVQAVFCIDVRSEVIRRGLEAQSTAVQTLGFAGFFGLPIAYQPVGAAQARPQLPGLLAPRLRVLDEGADGAAAVIGAHRASRLRGQAAWKRFKTGAVSGFSFVESLGVGHALKLATDSLGFTRPAPDPSAVGLSAADLRKLRPRLAGDGRAVDAPARATLAATALRTMGLTRRFARLVVLVGHGSQTVNNPHAAGLQCGACGGHTGEVNARVLASLLNDPAVRAELRARGIDIPATTWFVGGLHDTMTDEIDLFELEAVPSSHAGDLASLRDWLARASCQARRERAPRLGIDGGVADDEVRRAFVRRARDWGQVRPEWGLANNAAFIAAPRDRTRALSLGGRAFLHEYRAADDPDFATLEAILTAPVVVAHWINFQYYASTVDNGRFGSGNKVLHNVVGGHLGVFEGNGGDLRIGLPLQSLHDGRDWVHTPLRLSVFVEAPAFAIDAALAKHQKLRELVENGWLHLFQIEPEGTTVRAYRAGAWHACVEMDVSLEQKGDRS
jgi:uncharacterized protein YbcC (UPF0753/DUF2309 family)